MNKGLIFDIQRFSVNDGPGIRTTVFFKGCGLRCRWCHNPESIASYAQLSYDPVKCDGCGKCADFVDHKGIEIVDQKAVLDFQIHDRNLDLIPVCPRNAFTRIGHEIDEQELVSEVMKDVDYYESSQGGVTFSGGEALNQWPFIERAALLLKNKNIHLTLDVSGNDPGQLIAQTTNLIDLYLVDYKLTGNDNYETYVGRLFDPQVMLKTLYEANKEVILRCVMIPGINDTQEHFKAIASIKSSYPNITRVDILPYHKLRKRQKFQLVNQREFYEDPSQDLKDQWKREIRALGIRDVYLENEKI
jgi:glycyl-radical enzyme activating protein